MVSLGCNSLLFRQKGFLKHWACVIAGSTVFFAASSCSNSVAPCLEQPYIGVLVGEHEVIIDYDLNDGEGRKRAAMEGCHPDVSCP